MPNPQTDLEHRHRREPDAPRDAGKFVAELLGLAQHYRAEAVKLREQAREADAAARECRAWAAAVRQRTMA